MGDTSPSRDARKWQGPRARGKNGRARGKSRLPRVLTLLFVILALAGALVALAFFMRSPPQPLLVVIRIDQYDDEPLLPFYPWGEQDSQALRNAGLTEQGAFTSQERQRLLEALKKLGKDQPADQPLVIYLAAYAAGTENGGVALVPARARLDDPNSFLPLKEVLQAVKDCRVNKKLLLLDLAQPCTAPRGGLLTNDVAARLEPILTEAVRDRADLQILTSCSPGQVSLSSEELGHTVFAHYVVKATPMAACRTSPPTTASPYRS